MSDQGKTVTVESQGIPSWHRAYDYANPEITISGSAYIVVEEAVYRHTIFGPFADEEQAQAAVTALNAVSDGHHKYEVYLLEGQYLTGEEPQ